MRRGRVIRILAVALAGFLLIPVSAVVADQVIADDLIVDGSACVGFDCVNGESFGFDTIKLKENNLRIKFEDTSTAASFPSNDWQLTANDSSNGGQNKFSIDDISGGRTPFTVEAGAPSHSLYVDDGGRIGLGTSTPSVEIHNKNGDTPTLRLEQDGSSGFTAQTWDVAGNEAGFFVRDATNGSALPFRIRPGAPTSSIDVSAAGNVGINTGSPAETLHVRGTDGETNLTVEEASGTVLDRRQMLTLINNGAPMMVFQDTDSGVIWDVGMDGAASPRFQIAARGNGIADFVFAAGGNMTIAGTLTTGSSTVYPDYVFEDGYNLRTLDELEAYIEAEGHLPGVISAADVEAAGGINVTELQTQMLEKIEELTLYTLQQQALIDDLEERLEALEAAADGS